MARLRGLLAPLSLVLALCGALGDVGGLFAEAEAQRRPSSSSMRGSSSMRPRSSMHSRASGMRGSAMRSSMASSMRGSSSSMRGSSSSMRGSSSSMRARARRASAAYRRQVVRWHARPSAESVAAWEAQTPPPLVFRPVRYAGEYALIPDAQGLFSDYQLRAARKAFTYRDGLSHEVHPRLMALAYRIVREFRVPHLWLISGYRDGSATSRHGQGRAMDIVAPGVSNAQLARFARRLGFTGVGEYPNSGFVHVDIRARSYFWVDSSSPGGRSRERQVRRSEAQRADRDARARGEQPVPDVVEVDDSEQDEELDDEDVDGGVTPLEPPAAPVAAPSAPAPAPTPAAPATRPATSRTPS